MRHIVLCKGERFKLERWGGGTSYALTHVPSGRSVHLQGDDALAFEADMAAAEEAFPNATLEKVAAHLWHHCDYCAAAE